MTTSTPLPTADAAPSMAHPSDTASEAPPAQTRAAAAVRPSLRSQIAENPLLSFFGLLIVALLAAAIASPHIRIDDTNARIDRLEERMEARFDELEAAVAEIDRKLTALIAHLNATSAVDDALAGRLAGMSEGAPDALSYRERRSGPHW